MYPSFDEIVSLHKKYASSDAAFELIFTHCMIVRDIALSLIKQDMDNLNIELVVAGALLHDIGTYSLYHDGTFDKKNYITHGMRGYEILHREEYPESLCRIASNHIGAGIPKAMVEAQNLPMPYRDYFAETVEERLVMYADKFHSKTPKFNSYDSYHAFSEQFGKDTTERFEAMRLEFGLPDIQFFSNKYDHPIV